MISSSRIALCLAGLLVSKLSALDTVVVFNEVQYHPAGAEDSGLEFVELYNQNATNLDLSGWRISGGIDFQFPEGTVMEGGTYLVVASDPAALEAASGGSGFMGPFTGTLDNGGERIRLRNNNNRLLDELDYGDRAPWPLGADGSGASLSKVNPDTVSEDGYGWTHSVEVGGTPGAENFPDPVVTATAPLKINEVPGTIGGTFWIELYHGGEAALSLDGYVLSFEDAGEFVFSAGQSIGAGDLLLVNAATLGLAQNPVNDENVYLYNPGKTALLDALRIDDHGRALVPDGGDRLLTVGSVQDQTPGAPNAVPVPDSIVINEVMYHHQPQYATDGSAPVVSIEEVVPWGATWRYNEAGGDLGQGWASSAHSVGGDWKMGVGPLGFDSREAIVPFATTLTQPSLNDPRVITYYFETDFVVDEATLASIEAVKLSFIADDGAIFYLNGQELPFRHKMPEGEVNAATFANSTGEANSIESMDLDVSFLVEGSNRLSVEVHQKTTNSSDVGFGAKLGLRTEMPGEDPSIPYAENDEEWIEFYNRSDSAVSLADWELRGAVDFTFPSDAVIPSGGYLVVARDLADFSGKYPAVTAVGDFSGSLSNRGDRVILLDQFNNPADEVFYLDDKPWPSAADGGGASMELRHPDLDNNNPTAWADSDNAALSEWQTYEYSITALDPVFSPEIFDFHELRLGLLDAGVVLIDDISVTEDPGGAELELLENGSFDTVDGWRLLGTHKNSTVVDDGGNSVLRIDASARFSYLNNIIESNLTSNRRLRPVTEGTEYRIRFRAKWLSGSPQFRFELYYNKLAQVVILEQPEVVGTPGAQNSQYSTTVGPDLAGLIHQPAVPASGEDITVRVHASDPDGVGSLNLKYSVAAAAFQTVTMSEVNDGWWEGTIPGQASSRIIQFYVEASDASGGANISFAPPLGADSRAIIKVTSPNDGNGKGSVRINMLASDVTALHDPEDILSNHRQGCTLIVNEETIAYNSGIRLRGSMWSRRNANTGLNLKLPADRRYRGVHSTITVRIRARNEILMKHIINVAGGLHDNYNDAIRLNGHTATQNGPVRLEMTRFGSQYLKGLPGGDGTEGTVFKMEGIRQFQETQNGRDDSPKLPIPIGWVSSFDLADQGNQKEVYRHNMRINSALDRDDYSGIIPMCKLFSLDGQELEDAAPGVINVDVWTRQFALLSLCGIGDTYTQGNPHNLNFYTKPGGLVEVMPWDWDFVNSRTSNSPLWGNKNLAKLFARPAYTRLFHGHLHDLINKCYNAEYLEEWVDHLERCMGENYSSNLSYVTNRSNYVLSRLPDEIPFEITTNGGEAITISGSTATLEGDAWINVKEIRVNDASASVVPAWTDAESWVLNVPVAPGMNVVTLTAVDFQGNDLASDTIMITNDSGITPADADNLVVSEIMYKPLGGDTHEYLELMNISPSATIDLTGVKFVGGIVFDFPDDMLLPSGGRLLVVSHTENFETQYGMGHPVAGEFGLLSTPSNKEDTLVLLDASGEDIQRFTYKDDAPWPPAPDENGTSLVLKYPESGPDHSLPQNWRASLEVGGSPGESDASLYAGDAVADSDGDGAKDVLEHVLNSGLNDAASGPQFLMATGSDGGGNYVHLTFDVDTLADNVLVTPQMSSDLSGWVPGGELVSSESKGNGIEAQTFRFSVPAGDGKVFVRVLVTLR